MDERTGNPKDHRASGFPRLSGHGPDGGEYDALTELFLGDPELGPTPALGGRGMRGGDAPARVKPGAPGVRETSHEGGPAPRRVEAVEAEPAARCVEAVMLGHLPVRASIWVRQYANAVGTSLERPVGLVRIGTDASSVELIGPGAERMPLDEAEPASGLVEAVRSVAGLAERWIVRVDEGDEGSLAESDAVDEVTILTGSDEAAVVASYRLVKSLAATWDKAFGADGGPTLGLAIMGASGEQALAAGEKLERAAASFLQRPVRVTARVPKVGVSSAATIYRGSEGADAAAVIEAIRSAGASALRLAATPALHVAPADQDEPGEDEAGEEIVFEADADDAEDVAETIEAAAPADTGGEPSVADPSEADPSGAGSPEFERAAAVGVGGATREAAAPDTARAAVDDGAQNEERTMAPEQPMVVTRRVDDFAPKRVASSSPESAPRAEAPVDAESAAGLIAGLTVLESECPYAEGVRLASDGEGRLHLIADDSDGSDEAVRQLTAAATWAAAHLKLLSRAEPSLRHSGEPVRHLLTDNARGVRRLLDSDLRVHLVTTVTLGTQRGRVAVELN